MRGDDERLGLQAATLYLVHLHYLLLEGARLLSSRSQGEGSPPANL